MNYTYIKSALSYDPDSGLFTWKTDRRSKKIAGCVAGYLNDKGYVKIGVNGKDMPVHRLAFLFMTGSIPPKNIQVDHIKCIRNDNRWVI